MLLPPMSGVQNFHGVEKCFHSVDNGGFGPRMALVPAGLALRQSVRGARAFHAVEKSAKRFHGEEVSDS
jgi:hypothetical protein